jgi:pimeloyl-ACP methyl ester carboxylesterase
MHDFTLETARGRFGGLRNGNTGGMPLLALHGWLDNAASFRPMAPALAAAYDLVALDMPGHGRSFHYPADAEYSLFSTILDLLAAADALGWKRFALLGHSMGGAIGSLLAAAAPDRIERLYLIEALGPLSGTEDTTASRLRDAVTQRRALDGKRKRVFADPEVAVQARMQTNITALDEASSRLLIERGIRAVEGGYEWSSDARLTLPTAVRMTEAQVHDCLRAIACPVSLLVADPTPPYFPPALRDARIACVREIRNVSLPGSHHLHMTHPRETAAALGLG